MKKRYTLEQKKWDAPAEHAMPEHTRVPARFAIGPVEIAPATVLAPMAGVTDTVFRRFIKNASQFSTSSGDSATDVDVRRHDQQSAVGLRSHHDGVHLGRWALADARDQAQALPDVLRR